MLDTHGTLQQEILTWYNEIAQEKIIERVQNFVPDYDARADELQPFLEESDGLLMEHEAVALRWYTADGYANLNAYLRGGAGDGAEMRATVASAVAGMSKLPAFEGTVFRGQYLEGLPDAARFLARHTPGEIVEYSGFTSASYERGFGGNIQLIIRSVDGRVVESLAADPFEREVLFFPGTRFRVLTVEGREPVRIVLQELEDQNVAVPDSNKFAQGEDDKQPKGLVGEALQARAQNEAAFADPSVMAKFMAEHDGMTPLQYALATFPSARMEVEQHAPHLLSKKPRA
jgi:hypothetical protein